MHTDCSAASQLSQSSKHSESARMPDSQAFCYFLVPQRTKVNSPVSCKHEPSFDFCPMYHFTWLGKNTILLGCVQICSGIMPHSRRKSGAGNESKRKRFIRFLYYITKKILALLSVTKAADSKARKNCQMILYKREEMSWKRKNRQ